MKIKKSLLEDLKEKELTQSALITFHKDKVTKAEAEMKHLQDAIASLESLENSLPEKK